MAYRRTLALSGWLIWTGELARNEVHFLLITWLDIYTYGSSSDGKDDYVYVDENGALFLWYNRGEADTTMAIDGLRFADIDGDGVSNSG